MHNEVDKNAHGNQGLKTVDKNTPNNSQRYKIKYITIRVKNYNTGIYSNTERLRV